MAELMDMIAAIYDAAADRQRWQSFLKMLAEEFSAAGVLMITGEPERFQVYDLINHNVDPDALYRYATYYSTIDPRTPLMSRYLGDIAVTEQLVTDIKAFKKSEFFADLMAPNDLHNQMVSLSSDKRNWVVGISVMRPDPQEFGAGELELFRQLMPHISRACQLHMRITGMEGKIAAEHSALDRLSGGVMLVDGKGRVMHLNSHAENILREGDGLWSARGCLAGITPAVTGSLHAAIAAADATARKVGTSPGQLLAMPRKDGVPLAVLVSPLRLPHAQPNAPTVAVFIKNPAADQRTPDAVLTALYGLTPAEARVAAAMVAGLSVGEISFQEQITDNTTRSHVKAILAKTGASRQAEFIARVLRDTGWLTL